MPAGRRCVCRSRGLNIDYLESPPSVCAQRNLGVRRARSSWVFICDDDVEAPPQYLALLAAHLAAHPECGAVSGLFLEKGASGWIGQHPEESSLVVIWKFLFQLGLWGEIRCSDPISRIIKQRYHQKGNHIARSGWPVITDMNPPFFSYACLHARRCPGETTIGCSVHRLR